jgi:hypothetical protein
MRYKFYREHKYVSAAINDVERLLAKTDFTLASQRTKVKEALSSLLPMLKGHAEYENSRLHKLLRDRGSNICEHVEEEHREYEQKLQDLKDRLTQVLKSTDREEQIELGYQLYLWFRKFAGDNLLHLHEEETVILPELQRLYSDEELCQVEFESYQVMSSEDLIHMLEILFPHMNADDRLVFLTDIKSCDEKKFLETWKGIKSQIEEDERKHIESMIV